MTKKLHSWLCCAIWARSGLQGTPAYIVKRTLNIFLNKYMFCMFVVGRSIWLVHFISSSHAEEVWASPAIVKVSIQAGVGLGYYTVKSKSPNIRNNHIDQSVQNVLLVAMKLVGQNRYAPDLFYFQYKKCLLALEKPFKYMREWEKLMSTVFVSNPGLFLP